MGKLKTDMQAMFDILDDKIWLLVCHDLQLWHLFSSISSLLQADIILM